MLMKHSFLLNFLRELLNELISITCEYSGYLWVPELSSQFFGKDKKPKGKLLILYIDFPISFPVSIFLFICPALQLQQYNRLLIDIFSCL